MIHNILVVCTGNICRSPIAEVLLREKHLGGTVQSAGIAALIGHPADPGAVEVMMKQGRALDTHRARQVTRDLLAGSDLVLVMDQGHYDWLNSRYPEYRGRVNKLLRWQQNADVFDPYRQPIEKFEEAYDRIRAGVDDWINRI